jgi:hypothetical protein
MNYAFTLEVSGIGTGRENYEDALFEAGFDDALVAVVDGAMFLDFHRDGLSFEDAVKSASRNVELAGGQLRAGSHRQSAARLPADLRQRLIPKALPSPSRAAASGNAEVEITQQGSRLALRSAAC